MIGLDAAEPSLVEKWIEDGTLPNLRRARRGGAYGRLASTADWLVGSPWATFYTSTTPADHGFYHYLLWRADAMAAMRPTPDWLPLTPFWRRMGPSGPRVVAMDMPLTYEPEPFDGVEILGWATHELLVPPTTYPRSLLDWVTSRFGPAPYTNEVTTPLPAKALLKIRDELTRSTELAGRLAAALLEREKWGLFLVTLSAAHRGGHKFWAATSAAGSPSPSEREEMADALRRIYIACDAAVGRVMAQAGEDVTTLIFSLHGMGVNTCRTEILPAMLSRVLGASRKGKLAAPAPPISLAKRLRGLVPESVRHGVKSRLPLGLQDRLTTFWRMGGIDWPNTRAASLVADLQGYIRVNLKGREAAGIVEPGSEVDSLCSEIADGLATFVDADSGEPVVESVMRTDRLYPGGQRRGDLPDLLVRWSDSPAANHRAVISPRYGAIPWPTPGRNPDGRSGNHRPEGFLIACGEPFRPASRIDAAHILDLAPTAYRLLGIPTPAGMRGKPIL